MKDIVIYCSAYCPYCIMAKELLESKNVEYKDLRIDQKFEYAKESVKRSGGRKTVPQIFIGEYHVGGYDELYALDQEGKLDPLLES
ncbi:MAG: glutaredoxin 3 [Deltaproteobacteria bacterium]|nr:glutaredoxin 3 [Deltaproteobacteria bacterium]MBW1846840.1 glutaredoxin 3 [Deltaproteobacteria bacterium]